MSDTRPIAIAGAGIGGLVAAIALAQAGRKVLLLEQAEQLQEVGAGLQLSANACHCLEKIGVLDALKAISFQPKHVRISSGKSGQHLADVPLGTLAEKRYGAPYLVIHRADLQNVLLQKALNEANIDLRLGHQIENISVTDAASVEITCKTASDLPETFQACGLIGADGVRSQTRKLVRKDWEASYSGRSAYRTTIPATEVSAELQQSTGLWLGTNAHVVHYPVNQQQSFNIVVLVEESWQSEGWSEPANREEFLQRFTGWHSSIRSLLEKPQSWTRWALCAVDAEDTWSMGPITLLGDAAHAMLPFAAQGAGCAIEDALVLCNELTRTEEPLETAFQRYEAIRKPRAARIQKTAAKNGRIYHMRGPAAFARDTVLKLSSPESLISRMDWIYGWKP